MCSVSAAMIGLTAFQGINQMEAQRQQTKAQVAYYNAQADAANQNARIADQQRAQIADQYLQKQQQLDDRRKLIRGSNLAEAGASGLTSDGSVLDMNASGYDAWKNSSMNLLGNERNDTKSAYIKQVNYENQANAARASAYNARQQGRSAMFGTLLSTAANIYGIKRMYAGTGAKTANSTGSNMLHHQAAIAGMPETMEDEVYALNRYKPKTIVSTTGPYDWLK